MYMNISYFWNHSVGSPSENWLSKPMCLLVLCDISYAQLSPVTSVTKPIINSTNTDSYDFTHRHKFISNYKESQFENPPFKLQ